MDGGRPALEIRQRKANRSSSDVQRCSANGICGTAIGSRLAGDWGVSRQSNFVQPLIYVYMFIYSFICLFIHTAYSNLNIYRSRPIGFAALGSIRIGDDCIFELGSVALGAQRAQRAQQVGGLNQRTGLAKETKPPFSPIVGSIENGFLRVPFFGFPSTVSFHSCPIGVFFLIWSKDPRAIPGLIWFAWWCNQLPGPSIFPRRTPMLPVAQRCPFSPFLGKGSL